MIRGIRPGANLFLQADYSSCGLFFLDILPRGLVIVSIKTDVLLTMIAIFAVEELVIKS